MKNIIYRILFVALLFAATVFAGCGGKGTPENPVVYPGLKVTNCNNNLITLDIGEQFKAEVGFTNNPAGLNINNFTPVYSCHNTSVITVDQNTGVITAIAVGESTLNIKMQENSKISGTCIVKVIDRLGQIDGGLVIVNAVDNEIKLETTDQFQPEVQFDSSFAYDIKDFTPYYESDNTSVFSVDRTTGKISAIGEGSAWLKVGVAEASNIYGRCKVTVTNKVYPKLVITNAVSNEISLQTTDKFTVAVNFENPAAHKISDYTLSFTSENPSIFTVGQSTGVITAVAVGETWLVVTTVEEPNISLRCKVKVASKVYPKLVITNAVSNEISLETTDKFTVAVNFENPAANKISDYTLSFTSENPSIFTVGQSTGVITAVAAGETWLVVTTVEEPNISLRCKVKVASKAYPSLSITNAVGNEISLKLGKQFTAAVGISSGSISDYTLVFSSSNANVFTVTQSGVITAVGEGEAELKVKAQENENIYTVCMVKVVKPVLTITNAVNNEIAVALGKQFTAAVGISSGSISDYTLVFSSDNTSIFTVNSSTGLITGVAEGQATLRVKTAENENIYTSCLVKVAKPVLTITNAVSNEIVVALGKQFTAAVGISSGSISDYTLVFSSDNTSIFTVNSSTGLITSVAEGQAILRVKTAENENIYTSCLVKVTPAVPSSNLTVTNATDGAITVIRGRQLAAVVNFENPLDDNINNYTLSFTSSNPAVFKVSAGTGLITGVGVGEATLYVKAIENESLATSCKIKVVAPDPIVVTNINVSYTDIIRVKMNQKFDLGAYVSILPKAASFADIVFYSDNDNVALVDEFGVVTGFNYGWTKINIASLDGNVIASCNVHVYYLGYSELDRTGWTVVSSQPSANDIYIINGNTSNIFSWTKPGVNEIPVDHVPYFIIDMKKPTTVDYFIWRHRTDNLYEGLRLQEASVYGSNDGVTFTLISSNLAISTSSASCIVEFARTECRYFKLVCTKWPPRSGSSYLSIGMTDFKLGYSIYLPAKI